MNLDINSKIEGLHADLMAEFKKRNDALLSICESSIEKFFLIQIIHFYYEVPLSFVKFDAIWRQLLGAGLVIIIFSLKNSSSYL